MMSDASCFELLDVTNPMVARVCCGVRVMASSLRDVAGPAIGKTNSPADRDLQFLGSDLVTAMYRDLVPCGPEEFRSNLSAS